MIPAFSILRLALKTLDESTLRLTLDVPMDEMESVTALLNAYAQSMMLDSDEDDDVQWRPTESA